MAQAIARAKFLRIAPRKLRLVADLVRGKKVADARSILQYTVKAGAPILGKVLASAVANAESKAAETRERIDTDDMVVSKLLVNEGLMFRRIQPRARGHRTMLRKRTSHIELIISEG